MRTSKNDKTVTAENVVEVVKDGLNNRQVRRSAKRLAEQVSFALDFAADCGEALRSEIIKALQTGIDAIVCAGRWRA